MSLAHAGVSYGIIERPNSEIPMRALLAVGLATLATASVSASGHGRCRGGLAGYGPVNPYQWTMTSDLYTTNLAPTFRDFRGGGIRAGVPTNSSDDRSQRPASRQGSIPGIVLPPPNPIANPQLTPPSAGGTSTDPRPPGPTPASVKPSSSLQPNPGPNAPQSISPNRR
jgi:hypothetical protein